MTALSFTQIEINGFRGLRSLNLEGLGRINVLVGNNNSGKTSVLEALSILCQPQNPDEWLSMVRRRDFGGLDETIVQSLRWCFTQEAVLIDPEILMESACEFKCDGNFPLRELSVKYNEFREPSPNIRQRSAYLSHFENEPIIWEMIHAAENEELKNDYLAKIKRMRDRDMVRYEKMMRNMGAELMRGAELTHFPIWSKPQTSFLDWIFQSEQGIDEEAKSLKVFEGASHFSFRKETKSPSLDCKTLTPYSYQTSSYQLKAQSKRIFQNDSPSALELLKDFDADIEGIDMASFSGNRAAIYIKHRKLGVAPLSIFGDAMRRAVLLAATLPSLKAGGILLIDEVEVGIHVDALANVFKWLVNAARKLEIQIFVTTHSLEALDAIISTDSGQSEDDIVAFHLSQTEEKTECKRFSGDLLYRLRFERGLDLR